MALKLAHVFGLAFVMSALCLSGCFGKASPTGTYVAGPEKFLPLFSPKAKFSYLLDGTKIDATFNPKVNGETHVLELIAHGKVFEREIYQVTASEILLVESLGDRYDKAIPLLRFPLEVGEEYTWEGKMLVEDDALECKAKVRTSDDTVKRGGRTIPAIQIDVALAIRQGDLTQDRKLSFWFVLGEGILQRQFGVSERTVED